MYTGLFSDEILMSDLIEVRANTHTIIHWGINGEGVKRLRDGLSWLRNFHKIYFRFVLS